MTAGRRAARLPGFPLTLGISLSALSLIVLLPLAALALSALRLDGAAYRRTLADPRVLAAIRLSLTTAFAGAAAASLAGLLVAWVLVRYRFPFRRLVDALVDLPFAPPTAIAGIALTTLWAPTGWLGRPLGCPRGEGRLHAARHRPRPSLHRPAVHDPDSAAGPRVARPRNGGRGVESGATRWDVFRRVLLPQLVPAWLTGFTLAFARGSGVRLGPTSSPETSRCEPRWRRSSS